MAQRVAIALAIINDPDLLLLDEPFGSLDALTRERMWNELSRIWQMRQKTVIMVTHSINESLFLAVRVLVLTQRPAKVKLDLKVDLPRPRVVNVLQQERFVVRHQPTIVRQKRNYSDVSGGKEIYSWFTGETPASADDTWSSNRRIAMNFPPATTAHFQRKSHGTTCRQTCNPCSRRT